MVSPYARLVLHCGNCHTRSGFVELAVREEVPVEEERVSAGAERVEVDQSHRRTASRRCARAWRRAHVEHVRRRREASEHARRVERWRVWMYLYQQAVFVL